MRKGRDGEKQEKGGGGKREKKKRLMIIVATTSLPAVDCPNAERWNAARSRQYTVITIGATTMMMTTKNALKC